MIYLQISIAQGPAECQMFGRFALQKILREAEAAGVEAEILEETSSKHGILSAVLKLSGSRAESLAASWQGTLQWVCPSPLRLQHPRKNWYIGVFRLPEIPALPENEGIEFQTCRAGGKGGQHVNKTESAVRASAASTPIKNVRWSCSRSSCPNTTKPPCDSMPPMRISRSTEWSAATRGGCLRGKISANRGDSVDGAASRTNAVPV